MVKRKRSVYGEHTSYLDYLDRIPVEKNNAAFRSVLIQADLPLRVYEFMAGAGLQTRIIQEQFPNVKKHTAYDLDPRCCDMICTIPGVEVHNLNVTSRTWKLTEVDLLVADPNTFTLRQVNHYRYLFTTGAGQLILTDIAYGKLHLHYRTYGLKAPTFECYTTELSRLVSEFSDLQLVAWSDHVRSITYLLWKRP